MMALPRVVVCALVGAARANIQDLTAGGAKILGELGTAEHMLQAELHGHPKIMKQEMQLLHGAEDALRRAHTTTPSSELVQERSTEGTGKILNELSAAEKMIKEELHGHPTILREEMGLLHSAEDAARRTGRHSELIQHKSRASETTGAGKIVGELGVVEKMARKALAGHPKELQMEESALHQAEQAAKAIQHPRRGALLAVRKTQTDGRARVQVSAKDLQQQRSRSMASAMQEERKYGAAERQLANDGNQLLSEFGKIEDSIAQTFAGKDSKAVKTAMKVGELLDKARDEQQRVSKLNAAEAAKAGKDADALATAFAQTESKSKAMQEQQAYTAEMSNLVKDEKSVLSEFAGLKTAVAQAFAGQDGKAVEKAMEVGELLDQAREGQKQVLQRDAKSAAGASKLFQETPEHGQRVVKKALLQRHGLSLTSSLATHASRMQGLASREHGLVRLTEKAEDAITRELAKDGRHAAMAAEHEVISMMERAKRAEEEAYAAAARSAKHG